MVKTARRALRQRLLVPSEVKPGTFDADAITWQIDDRPIRGVGVNETLDVYTATIDSSRRNELLAGESIRKAFTNIPRLSLVGQSQSTGVPLDQRTGAAKQIQRR